MENSLIINWNTKEKKKIHNHLTAYHKEIFRNYVP